MQVTDVAGREQTGLLGLTAYQWKIFLVTWMGWALDSTDFGLFAFVLRPAVTELLGGRQPRPRSAALAATWRWLDCWAGPSAASFSA